MNKIYNVYFYDKKVGTTLLEKADAPMGVVFGIIRFIDLNNGYQFIKDFCESRQVELIADYPDEKLIATRTTEHLKIEDENGVEIKGVANQIEGMDDEGFEISIHGVPYPFYEEEFPHHVEEYKKILANQK